VYLGAPYAFFNKVLLTYQKKICLQETKLEFISSSVMRSMWGMSTCG